LHGFGGGNPGTLKEPFCENFGTFEPCRSLSWAYDLQIAGLENVYNPGYQGRFRPHDSEVNVLGFGQIGIIRNGCGGRNTPGDPGCACIARGRYKLGHTGRLGEPPGEGMFAAPASNDQNLQRVISSVK
jgi:hypothetical protein